jgi:hypothetical protein
MSILSRWNGFEELELNGGTLPVEVTAAAEDAARAEVAEVQVELEQQGQEIEELRAEVANQDEALEEVQELVSGMESMLGSGSFHSQSFASLYNRAAKLNTVLGGASVDRCGTESMTDAATALVMARTGMESFMETVKGYAKKAIEVIKHIFNTIINFFVGLVNAAEKLDRRATQIGERLEKTEKLKEKVKLGGWNVLFDYEKHGLAEGTEGWGTTLGALRGFADVASDVNKVSVASFNSAYGSLVSAIKGDAKKDVGAAEKSEGDKKVLIGMSAGIRVHAEMKDGSAKDLAEAAEMARSVKLFFGTGDAKKLTSGESAPKADKAKLKSALAEVKAIASQLRSDKVSAAFSKSVRDKVIGTLNVVKADDKEKEKEVNAQVALVRAVYSSASSATQAVNKQLVRCANWTCDAVAAHI